MEKDDHLKYAVTVFEDSDWTIDFQEWYSKIPNHSIRWVSTKVSTWVIEILRSKDNEEQLRKILLK